MAKAPALMIGLYCSASNKLDEKYYTVATEFGQLVAEADFGLVYGGGNRGSMGAAARGSHTKGGYVVGVMPERLSTIEGIAYELTDEMLVTQNMYERKDIIDQRSHAFVALPGGFGTLDEILESMTHKQLGYHDKPIVLINQDGFYDAFLMLSDQLHALNFAHSDRNFEVVNTPAEAVAYIVKCLR